MYKLYHVNGNYIPFGKHFQQTVFLFVCCQTSIKFNTFGWRDDDVDTSIVLQIYFRIVFIIVTISHLLIKCKTATAYLCVFAKKQK